eukprot:jgi/Undpi1/5749/HiC_scaffold_2.g01023.m1
MSQGKRKAWNATVQGSGLAPPRKTTKRASGRAVVLSKSMRVVDEETRNQVKDARLEALEADNYTEDQGGEQDDEFALDEDDERGDRQRARRSGKAPGSKGKNKGEIDKWKERKFKSLHQVLYELQHDRRCLTAPTAVSMKGTVPAVVVASTGEIGAPIVPFDDGTTTASYLAVRQATPAVTSKTAAVIVTTAAATTTAGSYPSLDRDTTDGTGCDQRARIVIAVGDIFDRGDNDLPIQEWVYRLARDAGRANGAVYSIMGNHEVINALGDHSMATRKAFLPFLDLRPELDTLLGGDWSELDGFPEWARCRLVAMRPGGPVARLMAAHAVCMKVGDNLFVHAGLLPEHVRRGAVATAAAGVGAGGKEGQIEVADADMMMRKLNSGACSWLLGNRPPPEELLEPEGPVWTRVYSDPDCRDIDQAARAKLEETLRLTGAKRMIVGHTPQRAGINSAADGQVWRVDTGMTAMIGGRPEVLEIRGEEITILTEHKPVPGSKRASPPPRPVSNGNELRRQ